MKITLKHAGLAAMAALLTTSSFAAQFATNFSPAVLYETGGKFDKSFNEAAYLGAERFRKETGISFRDAQVSSDAQREQLLRDMARKGMNPIIAVGFSYTQTVGTVAAQYPKTRFVIIDAVAKGPNVESIVFREQEGAFLVGMAAALKSKSNTVGFIGGMDVPLIRTFACGYVQGVKYINKNDKVIQNMVGSTPSAFNDPARGAELAKSQFDRGADVVFTASGNTGLGILQAANRAGKFSIGVDSNQNHLYPGSVLTSMVKRVDVAIYNTFKEARANAWKPGIHQLGLKENGIDWALDAYNRKLITPAMEKRINEARQAIISGKLNVVDYRTNNSCPVN